jgi:phage shock protein PspC (stress-responsive transcriptional regulator)
METNTSRRLHKGRVHVIGGVCSGIAEYFAVDVTVVRIIFALLALSGAGIVLYLLLWLLMPAGESSEAAGEDIIGSGLRSMGADLTRIGAEL